MPIVNLHKLFYHAKNIAQFFILSINQILKEARHKDFREKNTYKMIRLDKKFGSTNKF